MSPVNASIQRKLWSDAIVLSFFAFAAAYVISQLWFDPGIKAAPVYEGDQALFQWYLAHAVRVVTHLENPLTTTMLNAPEGVNLMANTPMLGLAIPLIPVTLLFGAHVSLLVALTLALAGTAAAWYFVLSRHVVSSTFAAAVGGWLCGFSPVMISHASWHPNITFQLLVPIIVLAVLKLREPGRAFRNGVTLALLVVYQAFVTEEILFLTASACAVFLLAYAVLDPPAYFKAWRPMSVSLVITAIVAGVLLAYPLWMQFFGPHHYRGLSGANKFVTVDLGSITAFATESLAGSGHWIMRKLLVTESEESIYFGWPLLGVLVIVLFLVRKSAAGRALRVTALIAFLFGLGAELRYGATLTGISGPWAALDDLPVLDSVIPARFGFVVAAVFGVLLAMATQNVWDYAAKTPRPGLWKGLWAVVLTIGLLPVAPTPLDAKNQPPVPRFISGGSWRSYVRDGETVVPVPVPSPVHTDGMRWAAAAEAQFALPGGYFLYPKDGDEEQDATLGAPPRPTALLLDQIESTGRARPITEIDRQAARTDLRFWRAAIIVLPARERNADALRATVEALVGPAQRNEDVWLWDVRDEVRGGGGGG